MLTRSHQMPLVPAFKTALNMSIVSMVAMEMAMEMTDYCMTGGLGLNIHVVLPMLLSGFSAPLPYNYYRLRRYNKGCH